MVPGAGRLQNETAHLAADPARRRFDAVARTCRVASRSRRWWLRPVTPPTTRSLPIPDGLISLTVNKFRRLFDAPLLAAKTYPDDPARLVDLATMTPTPSPTTPLPTTRTPMITIYGCSY